MGVSEGMLPLIGANGPNRTFSVCLMLRCGFIEGAVRILLNISGERSAVRAFRAKEDLFVGRVISARFAI